MDISAQTIAESGARAIEMEIRGLDMLVSALRGPLAQPFADAVACILGAKGRMIITGMGKSGHIGRKIAATMASTGTPASFVHPGEASHGDLGMIREEDVILALSWSGGTSELGDIITYSRRFRVPLIAITSNAQSGLALDADIALILPKAAEACPNGLAPTTSTTMQLAMGDALAVALLEKRGFTPEKFRIFHPGGKLGAQLRRVRDIMHTGERLPLVRENASIADVALEIGKRGFGCCIVIGAQGELAGIVTDGDLRRNLSPGIMELPVSRIMSTNPRTIPPDMLLAAAIEMQERLKITHLVVAEGKTLHGLVHYLDLLRAGAA